MDRMSASVKDWGEVCTVNVASVFLSEFCVCDMTDPKIETFLGRSVLTICSSCLDVLIYIAVLSVPYYLQHHI